ncbi:DUF1064 domain-containing protein [Bacillus cereus]|jgi:hypothetical protein|uniref:DUF1064 domain-containing protein n=1 Tax=Bacillus cereus TaxID=1396 RepID=UPI000BF54B35|nr:DUF1064 domain-containing protein [Bacillus cereus]PFK68293.1 hypothetical protein COJ25_17300 [Bacillus cereus]
MSKQRNGKYNARKTETDGIKFASALEGKYYQYLKRLQEAGEVTRFDMQPSFVLQGGFTDAFGMKHEPIKYVGDFLVYYKDKPPVVIDVKGMTTSVFAIKRKLYCNMFPLELVVLGYSKVDGGFVPMEVIKEGRKARKKEKEKLDKEILRYLLEVNPNITETAKHFGVTKARVTKLANKEAKLNG